MEFIRLRIPLRFTIISTRNGRLDHGLFRLLYLKISIVPCLESSRVQSLEISRLSRRCMYYRNFKVKQTKKLIFCSLMFVFFKMNALKLEIEKEVLFSIYPSLFF